MIINKDFILVGAGFDNINTRLPSVYNENKHFRNAERLTKKRELTIGEPIQAMLKNVKDVVDKVIDTKDLNIRSQLTKQVATFMAKDLENKRQIRQGYKPTHKLR